MISDKPKRTLPHREPFLWVQRLIERSADGLSGVVEMGVPLDLDVFRGHFPGNPIFPGVLQVEAAAQAVLWVFKGELPEGSKPPVGYLAAIDSFKFKRPVVPPAVVTIKVQRAKRRSQLQFWTADIYVGEDLVSAGSFWLRFAIDEP